MFVNNRILLTECAEVLHNGVLIPICEKEYEIRRLKSCLEKKGSQEVPWCGVNSIIAGVHKMERTREGVAALLSNVWHSAVGVLAQEFSGLNSRFQGLKLVWLLGIAPMKEMVKKEMGSGTTWTGFWIV